MDAGELGQIETAILSIYLPATDTRYKRAVRKLCAEKGIKIFDDQLRQTLNNLLASVIRHRETDYDQMCAAVGKQRARFYVQPIVKKGLKKAER